MNNQTIKELSIKKAPVIGLLLIGDELLSGRRQDKHLPKVIELLTQRGLSLSWMHCLGDDRERLVPTLKQAFSSSDIVFCCGGIGSTPDDHTRQSAAAALDLPLCLHSDAKELIVQRMQEVAIERNEVFDENSPEHKIRLEMGMFPKGAKIIPNAYNKIPGFSFGNVHFMPGFPVMAWPMMEWVLEQNYSHLFFQANHVEYAVILPGAKEAELTPMMEQLEQSFPGVKVFSLPSVDHPQYGHCIELGVKGEKYIALKAFEQMCQQLEEKGIKAVITQ